MSEFWNDPNDPNEEDVTGAVKVGQRPLSGVAIIGEESKERKKPKANIPLDQTNSDATDSLLTSQEAAQLLRMTPKGLRAMAQKGRIGHFKLGREYRFRKNELLNMMLRVEATNK
jgi:excisionase family DNA binding protein